MDRGLTWRGAAGALVCLAALAAGAYGSEVPEEPASEGLPQMRTDEQGHVLVEDRANNYRLSLPGRYWECKTGAQLGEEAQGAGCAGAGRVPAGLLVAVQHKDAHAWAYLRLAPERFLMRDGTDLESYVEARHNQFLEAAGAGCERTSSSFHEDEERSMIVADATFAASVRGQAANYRIVYFFVRPEGEDARLYEMACAAPQEEFERLAGEFGHMIDSFRFTGPVAARFFAPDAPEQKLPVVEKGPSGAPACGGGYMGMIVAMLAVFLVYWMLRRRGSAHPKL